MLFFEEDSGQFVSKNIKDEEMWVVLVYNEGEDWTDLAGQTPYIYDSKEDFIKAFKNQGKEFIDYISEGYTLVIRKINCKVIRED